ncbi:MAG: hypothetical protein PHI48_08525 [Bacteroidales bacterium]|nr:hypothetical protein [Bacteroidales bacterium]
MKHLRLISTLGFVLLTVLSATAQTDPEQEVIAYMVKSTVFPEPNTRYLELLDKQIKENPRDTAKINLRKRLLSVIQSEKTKIHPILLITDTFLGEDAKDSLLVNELKKLSSFDMEAYKDLIERNKESIVIQTIDELGTNVIYMTRKERDLIFKDGLEKGWEYFYKKYGVKPNIVLSRPGFNATKDKAIISYGSISGSLSAAGYYIILEKVNGKWIRKDSYLDYIS